MTLFAREGYPRWSSPRAPWAAFPKVSLHDHLDGSLRPETLIELADASGLGIPYDDPELLSSWFRGEILEPVIDDWDEKFGVTTAVMQTPENIARVAREWVVELAADGVLYGEARWAPEKHTLAGLPMEVAVEAVAAGLAEGERDVAIHGGRIRTRQILCGMRSSARSLEIAQLTAKLYGTHRVVGFDIAGPEHGYPIRDHLAAVELLEREGIPSTIHAGEGDGVQSLWETVHLAHAVRIGHGPRIIEDVTLDGEPLDVRTAVRAAPALGDLRIGRTAQWVIDRGIPLEICVTSNLADGLIDDLDDHPVDLLRRLGFAVTLNPDNRGISKVSLTGEVDIVADRFGWGVDEFTEVSLTAASAAFLPGAEKTALVAEVRDAASAFTLA